MPQVNSVVAIYETHVQAAETVKELQGSGFDMKKLSIASDVKTGRVFLIYDGPWAVPFKAFSYRRTRRRGTTIPAAA